MITGVDFDALLADKAFDANWLIQALQQRDCHMVISQMSRRKNPLAIDPEIYKWRHPIENFF